MIWIKRIGAVVAGLVLVAIVGTLVTGTVMTRRSFATTDGNVPLPGLDAPVEVLRNEQGVPTIVASTTDDLFRAQGYVHAQDRFWEMDSRRHITAGRLSELFGGSQVATDTFVRTLGWRHVAEQELALLEEETRQMLTAYAEGVNAWLEGRSGSQLSLEHALLPVAGARGYAPEPWTPVDSLAWLKAMAWDLRSNLDDELERARLQAADLGPGREWRTLFPDFPADRHPPILPDGGELADGRFVPGTGLADPAQAPTVASIAAPANDELTQTGARDPGASRDATRLDPSLRGEEVQRALAAADDAIEAAPQLLGDGSDTGIGSNSWVIAPERSATGTALLANDPHLGPSQPSLWYQVGLRCEPIGPDCPYHVLGFSFSGVPGIVIGQTDRVAWGFTNLGQDVIDLVVERIDGDRYLTEDGWQPLDERTETIRVAGGDDVEVVVRATRHGPVFSDVSSAGAEVATGPLGAGGSSDDGSDEHAVAIQWTALEPAPTMDAIVWFMRARDWASFREGARRFLVPSQNLVYADVDGHIGYQAPGRVPVRSSGDGTAPQPGWTGEALWDGELDFDAMPWTFDPTAGAIMTANQPVLPGGSEPFLSRDFNHGYRGARIAELLDGRDDLTLDDLLEVQLDAHNGNGANLVGALTAVPADADPRVQAIQDVLEGWDLQDAVDSAGSAAFNATWRHLLAATFHDELPEWAWPTGSGRWWEVVRGLVAQPDAAWWDDVTTPQREQRDDVLHASMAAAHDELVELFSDDPGEWRWGEMHTLTLTHQTFGTSGIGVVERLFNRGPLELPGGSDVVQATGWVATQGYEVTWVPSMRYLVDLGDLDAGSWIHPTGQSGRPFHPNYTDQAATYAAGGTFPIAFSAEAVAAAAVDRLTLVPDGG